MLVPPQAVPRAPAQADAVEKGGVPSFACAACFASAGKGKVLVHSLRPHSCVRARAGASKQDAHLPASATALQAKQTRGRKLCEQGQSERFNCNEDYPTFERKYVLDTVGQLMAHRYLDRLHHIATRYQSARGPELARLCVSCA